jgi:membrane protein implicated in regulation of membrane protease activity
MFGREPAVILGAIQAVLALGLSFGLQLTPEKMGAIMAAAAAIIALLVRRQVSPVGQQTAPAQNQSSAQQPG